MSLDEILRKKLARPTKGGYDIIPYPYFWQNVIPGMNSDTALVGPKSPANGGVSDKNKKCRIVPPKAGHIRPTAVLVSDTLTPDLNSHRSEVLRYNGPFLGEIKLA